MSAFSDRLKNLRGPTPQSQFAAELGMKQQQYARYEKGVTVPGIDVLATICRVHACSADWLLGIDRAAPAVSVIGNGNAVANGTGARAVAASSAQPGDLPQCAKCPLKKRLAKIERALGK